MVASFFASVGLFFGSLLPSCNHSTLTNTQKKQLRYEKRVLKNEARYNHKLSLQKKSGYMLNSQYEAESYVKDKTKESFDFIPKPDKKDWKYYPEPTYKIVRYNDPPGTHELNIHRPVKFNRSEILPGIISPDFKYMIYPEISYFVTKNAIGCDLYILPLDLKLPPVKRVLKANIACKITPAILSTTKNFSVEGEFRTLTPVDFSPDASKVIIKEKIGSNHDGIWRTDLWVYDAKTKQVKKLEALREAVLFYWKNDREVDLESLRWDIQPLGFDATNPNAIIVNTFAYTGAKPKFLGAWSISYDETQTRLVSLDDQRLPVNIVGFKIVEDGIVDPLSLKAENKRLASEKKQAKKAAKKQQKFEKKLKNEVYKKNLKEIDEAYKQKIKGFKVKNTFSSSTELN